MCDECENYGFAADFLSFSPVCKYYLPEKYFSILKQGWTSSIASYTGFSSEEEFLGDVEQYACFPGSHIYFGMALADPLPTTFHMHHNLKNNEQCIYKQDILNIMQRIVNNLEYDHGYNLHVRQMLFVESVTGIFLKTVNLLFLQGNFDLVPFPETILTKFSEQLEEKVMNVKSVHKVTGSTSCDEIMRSLTKIFPVNKKSPEFEALLKTVENCGVEPTNVDFFERCINPISVIIGEIKGFINSHRELLLPRKAGQNFVPTVRVFDDGNNGKFVLLHELWKEMTAAKLDTSRIEIGDGMPELQTEHFEAIQILLGNDFDKITFVNCKIRDTSPLADFIPSIDGKFCFKVSCFLLETIGEMITTHGYFQNLNATHWDMLTPLFDEFVNRLERETSGCLLIETQSACEMKKWILEETEKVFARRPKKTKEIRTIRGDWFTVRDVKNELKRLGITESFSPQFDSVFINDAYNYITNQREVGALPTRYFHETLETIQVTLVMNTFEKIWHKLHVCGDCNYIFSECIFCDESASSSENESQTLMDKKAEKKKEKKKRQAEKKKLAKEKQEAVEEVVPGNDSSDNKAEQVASGGIVPDVYVVEQQVVEVPTASQPSHVLQVALESDLTSEATQQNPIPGQSTSQEPVSERMNQPRIEPKNVLNSCSKCFRTSQHCEKVKIQLKEEKIKTKALNKKVVELSETVVKKDETIIEKDEEIRLLKEKLAAMEASLQQSATKSIDQPSTSEQLEEEEEEGDEQPVRYLTPTYKNSEFSVETRAKFNELLNIKDSHTRLERQAKQRARALINKSEDFGTKRMASRELVQILKSYEAYFQVVEDNIKWIQKHKNNNLDKLIALPELHKFSDNFEATYDEVVNEELSDKQCPVCIEEISDLSGTIKCKCKKRYHVHCAWDMDVNGYKCYCKERLPLD